MTLSNILNAHTVEELSTSKCRVILRARVLIFNDTPRNGGPGKVLLHFLRYTNRNLISCSIHLMRPDVLSDLYRAEDVAEALSFDAKLIENPIQPLSRPMEKRDFDAAFWLKAVRAAVNLPRAIAGVMALGWRVRRGRYDLLYCNGLYAVLVGGLLARVGGIPVLWHLHDTSLPSVFDRLFRWLARSDQVRLIVCVSQASARMVSFAAYKTVIALNPVDLEEFDASKTIPALRQELGWPKDAIVFGSHGRVVARKGYMTMVRAARLALDNASADLAAKMRFVVVGDTPADHPGDHLGDCKALVQSLGMTEQFIFLGYRPDVRPYVADYDICIVPSIFAEPFGLTVVESFAFGVPVIASAVGGIPEIVTAGQTGLLVPANNPNALADAMLTYASDPKLRRQQGDAGRNYVTQHHDARAYSALIQHHVMRACARGERAI
jgi:glycosyltransferase involved in cell wall biosynthesis